MNHTSAIRIYPGWYQVAATVSGSGLGFLTIAIICFSIFVKPLQEEFGWQRGEIAIALSIATFVQALINPFLGALLDKLGVRRLLLPSIVLLAAVVASAYYLTDSLWHLYLIYFLIPLLGAGTGTMVYSRLLVNWFDRRRGMALGIGLSGIGLGAALVSPLLLWVVEQHGWRDAYLVFAGLVLFISFPIALLVVRETPAEAGIETADGDPRIAADRTPQSSAHLPLEQVFRSRPYLFLMAAYVLFGVAIGGIVAHLFPIMLDQGISAIQAGSAALLMGISIIIGRISCGVLMDKFNPPIIAALFVGLPAIGVILFAMGVSTATVNIAAVSIGLGVGAEFNSIAFLVSRFFGLKNFGKIYGHIYAIFQFGHGIGPIAMGIAFDRMGHYTNMLWVSLLLIAVAVVLTALLSSCRGMPGDLSN